MLKNACLKCLDKKSLRWLLILITVFSWFIFPLMAKQLNSPVFLIAFSICLFVVIIGVAKTLTRNQLVWRPLHKLMLVCCIGYLFLLLLATIASASTYSLVQWCILFAKFAFFSFLLFYINEEYIVATLRIYANLMVATVVFALVAVFAVATGVHPLATVDLGGRLADVYFGAYYVTNTSLCVPAPIFRIQGLSEEPGTYAFALLPAFFWLVIAEKAYLRSAVIVLGLMLSLSLGVGLFLLLLLPIMARQYSADYKVPGIFLIAICVIGLMYVVSGSCTNRYFASINNAVVPSGNKVMSPSFKAMMDEVSACEKEGISRVECVEVRKGSLSTTSNGKVHSFRDRRDGLHAAFGYLKVHPVGTGAALGMLTVSNSISVGYAVAVLEAGVVGGVFYLCLFAIMGWLALKIIITTNIDSFEGQVKVVVALSVCAVLMMGVQRMQPDLSFWHMWIYAMWFYLLQIMPGFEGELISEMEVKKAAT